MTIFEREPRLGGRVHTVQRDVRSDGQSVEAGGSAFDAWDSLMQQQAKDAGASISDVHDGKSPLAFVSTWDGRELALSEDDQIATQVDSVPKMLWHHGLSLRTWKQLLREIWENESGIDFYLPIRWRNSVRRDRSQPWLQPQRELLHEFSRSWGLATEPEKEAHDTYGMRNLLSRSIRIAGSSLNLNATVTRVRRYEDLTFDVHWTRTSPDGEREESAERFDAVIIAAPFHETEIEIEPPLPVAPEKTTYKPLHVTHFVSESLLDPTTFNLSPDEAVPDMIWDLRGIRQRESEPKSPTPSFLTLTRKTSDYLSGCLIQSENIYRVTSEQPFTDDNIATLFNRTGLARGDITFPEQHCRHVKDLENRLTATEAQAEEEEDLYDAWHRKHSGCELWDTKVRWVHRRFWPNAVPITNENSTDSDSMQRTELAPRLYYVSDFERRIGASITQSAKSAHKVAYKLYCDYLRSCQF